MLREVKAHEREKHHIRASFEGLYCEWTLLKVELEYVLLTFAGLILEGFYTM